jgi:KDO2-lipid IV(A) lauroyltransferase
VRTDSDLATVRWNAGPLNNGLVFGLAYHLARMLPRWCGYAVADTATWIAYKTLKSGTAALLSNLRVVCPQASQRERRALARLTYRTYARDTADFIRSLSMPPEKVAAMVTPRNHEQFDGLLARGRGVLLVGGHLGNWELGGVVLRQLHGCPLTVVVKAEASPVVHAFRLRMREVLGIDTLEIGQTLDTALRIRALLSANRGVAMLLDRHVGRDSVEVQFFGRPASFLRTPAMIGLMSGAPLLPTFMLRQPDGHFIAQLGDAIVVDASIDREDAVQRATQAFATQLEAQIRLYPHLWYQFYPYWPDGLPGGRARS